MFRLILASMICGEVELLADHANRLVGKIVVDQNHRKRYRVLGVEANIERPRVLGKVQAAQDILYSFSINDQSIELIGRELGGESVRKVVPSYNMNLWLMNEKGEFTRIPGKMGTFRANDEIILSIFENDDTIVDKNLKNLPFLTSSDQFDGLIIYRKRIKNILRRLNLPQDPRTLNIGFNTRNAIPLPVILVDNYLPNETVGMIREELYLDAYHGREDQSEHRKPILRNIYLYPRSIFDTPDLIRKIRAHPDEKYETNNAFDLENKVALIQEIIGLIKDTVTLAVYGIGFVAAMFVGLVLFRNLHKKRREIGVFLAFGMRKRTFTIFYLLESLIVSAISLAAALGVFYVWINPVVNERVQKASFFGNVPELFDFAEHPGILDLDAWIMLSISAGTVVFISLVFLGLIFSKLFGPPIRLLRGE